MFVSSSEPLLRERRPKSFFRVNIFYIFAIGLILTCVVCQQTVRNVFEAKVGGNEIGYPAGSSTLDLEAGFPPQAPPSPGSAVRASPTLSSGSSSPIPHDSQPAAQPQSPERPKSPLPSTKTGKAPVDEVSFSGLGLTDIPPIGSNQAGPSGTTPGGDEYSAPGPGLPPIPPLPPAAAPAAASANRVSFNMSPAGVPARCNDPVHGFQKNVKPCGNFYYNHKEKPGYNTVKLTYSTMNIVYLVDNVGGVCAGSQCVEQDVDACCTLRPKCSPHFANDVQGGCPANTFVNIHQAAYCATSPCTIRDAGYCCISNPDAPPATPWPSGSLFQYTGMLRSKYARSLPKLKSPVTKPEISFGFNDIAWFDMTKKRQVGTEEWAPLVNFFPAIGDLKNAWSTEAWMRIAINGKMLYRPASSQQMGVQSQVPPSSATSPK